MRRGSKTTRATAEQFLELLDLDFAQRSLANSAAILTIPAAHVDWLRPDIMLYGATPFADLTAKSWVCAGDEPDGPTDCLS